MLIQLSKSDSSTLVKRAGHSCIVVRLTGCKSRCKGLLVWTFLGRPRMAEMGKIHDQFSLNARLLFVREYSRTRPENLGGLLNSWQLSRLIGVGHLAVAARP